MNFSEDTLKNAAKLFTNRLYNHRFDIDDVITALCGSAHSKAGGRWLLNTQPPKGTLHAPLPADDLFSTPVGAEEDHWFEITPLPESFLTTLPTHPRLTAQPASTQHSILEKLNEIKTIEELSHALDDTIAGGWLRERVKDVALDWLDDNNLIPPSMRHVRIDPHAPTTSHKIKIVTE